MAVVLQLCRLLPMAPMAGPCRAGHFRRPRLPIPGILAVRFPSRPHRDGRGAAWAQAPELWRVGHDL
jgi:hypothetical protein